MSGLQVLESGFDVREQLRVLGPGEVAEQCVDGGEVGMPRGIEGVGSVHHGVLSSEVLGWASGC